MFKFATRNERLLALALKRNLLRDLVVCPVDAMPKLGASAVHDYVYKHFYTSNATSKETSAGRFRDLDPITLSLIRQHKLDTIHDVGVSSGVTSLDLYRALRSTATAFTLHISDKYAVYGCAGRYLRRIIDTEGSVRELYVCGILGRRQNVSNKWFPLTRFLYWLLAGGQCRGSIRWFSLFDYEVQQYVERGLIRRLDYDVFQTQLPNCFAFVRCMNVLNLFYFSPESIRIAVGNLVESLREGGILQIGRTHPDGTNHAAFYMKRSRGIELLREVGTGTEVREILAEFKQ